MISFVQKLSINSVLLVLTLAVLVRAFLPVGFMPEAQADTPFSLIICTWNGEMTLDDKSSSKDHNAQNHVCPFALQMAYMVLDGEPFLSLDALRFESVSYAIYQAKIFNVLLSFLLSRGPPVTFFS